MPLISLVARGDPLSLLLIPRLIPTMVSMAMEATLETIMDLVPTMEPMPLMSLVVRGDLLSLLLNLRLTLLLTPGCTTHTTQPMQDTMDTPMLDMVTTMASK